MELGYDSHGPSPMFSATSSSTAPLLLHMPLLMYVSLMNFYWMNSHRCPLSVPLPIPMFFGSYSSLGIALPLLPTLSRLVLPVRSIAHLQSEQYHRRVTEGSNIIYRSWHQKEPLLQSCVRFLFFISTCPTVIFSSRIFPTSTPRLDQARVGLLLVR